VARKEIAPSPTKLAAAGCNSAKARAAGVLIELQNAAADAKRTSAGMNE